MPTMFLPSHRISPLPEPLPHAVTRHHNGDRASCPGVQGAAVVARKSYAAGIICLLCLLLITPFVAAAPKDRQAAVQTFIDDMAARHGFDPARLLGWMSKARFRKDIIRAISRPAEARPWSQYRPIFLTRARIEGGERFWRTHRATLEQAQERFGVPPEIVTAIIGVETRYGAHTGRYRVLDALSTLAFGYPKRAGFFRAELEQFLLMTREQKLDPLALKGSYAGAMGLGQFIPSSYRAYAVDFDGNGKADLWDPEDAIGSVANYFARHGWRAGKEIAMPARITAGADPEPLLKAGLRPSLSLARLRQAGVEPQGDPDEGETAALLRLEGIAGPEYWLALHNFYVITRYNHSPLYAMAVYQLSREIADLEKRRRDEPVPE